MKSTLIIGLLGLQVHIFTKNIFEKAYHKVKMSNLLIFQNKKMKISVLIIILLLSGCYVEKDMRFKRQGLLTKSMDEFQSSVSCCDTFKDFSFRPFDEKKDNYYSMTNNQKVFEFQNGKSYFDSIILPENLRNSEFNVKSFLFGTSSNATGRLMFYPIVTLLDSDYNIIETIHPQEMTNFLASWGGDPGGGQYKFNANGAKYILLHTEPSYFDKTYYLIRFAKSDLSRSSHSSCFSREK